MKKSIVTLSVVAAMAFATCIHSAAQELYLGSDPVGTVSYALPQTVISIEVEAQKETFHAGPYAKFAKKYLGIDARQSDGTSCNVVSIKMAPYSEADQGRRFSVTPGKGQDYFLALTTQGLVSFGGAHSAETEWHFSSSDSRGDFSGAGTSSNLTSESATLYKDVRSGDSYSTVAVQQKMVVEKPLETKASEAADMIFNLREKKMDIITGNTDATYSGEAMASAIKEIDSMEKEYLSLFIGYSDVSDQKMTYDVVPSASAKSQRYIAFRVSDEDGLVSADNVSGKPYILELSAQEITNAVAGKGASGKVIYYRIPAICTATLSDGINILMQSRIPVYQLGIESSLPIQ